MASEYKLDLLYKKEFHQVFEENQDDTEFGPLMVRMKVVDANGESSMDEHQWEAASTSFFFIPYHLSALIDSSTWLTLDLYVAFAFQKRQ